MVKQIPVALTNPIAIFKSATEPGRLVVMLDLKDANGATVVVPVGIDNVNFGTGKTETATISYTDYPKTVKETNQPDNRWFVREAEAGRLLYVNTELASTWAVSSGSNSLTASPTSAQPSVDAGRSCQTPARKQRHIRNGRNG